MAILNITEFRKLAEDARGYNVPVGEMPPIKVQTVTYTTATKAAVFDRQTRFIRVLADADAYLKISTDGKAATVNDMKIEANVAEYFGIHGGRGVLQLSVYDGSS